MKLPELSVFIPSYNEAKNLGRIIPPALRLISQIAGTYELIIVHDLRSRDNSLDIIQDFISRHNHLKVVRQSKNDAGYGRALALGFRESRYQLIFYTDADDQYDLLDLEKMTFFLNEADLVIGYRSPRRDPYLRLFISSLYNKLVRTWFGLKTRDIDCSFKLVKKEVVEGMEFICRTGAMEIELILRARQRGCRMVEVPVRHRKRTAGISAFEAGEGRLFGLPRFGNLRDVFREMLLLKKLFPLKKMEQRSENRICF